MLQGYISDWFIISIKEREVLEPQAPTSSSSHVIKMQTLA